MAYLVTPIHPQNDDILLKETYDWITRFYYENVLGEYFSSPAFVGEDNVITWKLIFYQNGVSESMDSNVSAVYLKFESPIVMDIVEKFVIYKFWVFHNQKERVQSKTCCTKILNHYRQPDLTLQQFYDADILWQFKNGLHVNGGQECFTIKCNWKIIEARPISLKNRLTDCCYKFKDFLKSEKLSDVKLVAGEQQFAAHKIILAAHSPVFSAMFEHEMQEKRLNIVDIPDITSHVLEELLRFIYIGNPLNLHQNARGLLAAADKYQIEPLKNICEKSLQTSLTVENCIEILILADVHNAKWLKQEAMDVIVKNSNKIVKTGIHLPLQELSYHHLLSEVLCAIALENKTE